MRYAILQVLGTAGGKTKRLVEFCKINLGPDLYLVAVKKAESLPDAFIHQLPSGACGPVCRRGNYTADTGCCVGNARRDDPGIGNEFTGSPTTKMVRWLVLIISILVNTVLLNHKNLVSQLHDGVKFCCGQLVEFFYDPVKWHIATVNFVYSAHSPF